VRNYSTYLREPLAGRFESERRSTKFERVPTASSLIATLIEEALDAREKKAPRAAATAEGQVTNTKGIGR